MSQVPTGVRCWEPLKLRPYIALTLVILAPLCSYARTRAPRRQTSGVTQRKRLHINKLLADPGTVEIDWAYLYSYTTGIITLPSAIKYTPCGDTWLWGRTEYSVAFDSINSATTAGGRATQFSDRLTFQGAVGIKDTKHFDVAFAPQITVLLRNDSGVRYGATALFRVDAKDNSIGFTAGWSAATAPSDTNPAGVVDLSAAYGRPLWHCGFFKKLTPHLNATYEKATGFDRTVSVFGGVEYEINKRLAFDISGQRYSFLGAQPDRQLLAGFTYTLGKSR